MNALNAVGVYPLFYNPANVNNLGSFHPPTCPFNISYAILRFDNKLCDIFNLLNSYTTGLYKFRVLSIQQYSSLLFSNSNVHNECVICSTESHIQCAKSYIGYTFHYVPLRGWECINTLYITGSLNAGLQCYGSILNRNVYLDSACYPYCISQNILRLS